VVFSTLILPYCFLCWHICKCTWSIPPNCNTHYTLMCDLYVVEGNSDYGTTNDFRLQTVSNLASRCSNVSHEQIWALHTRAVSSLTSHCSYISNERAWAMRTRTVSRLFSRFLSISEARDAFFFHAWGVARPIACRLDGTFDLTAKVMPCDTTGNWINTTCYVTHELKRRCLYLIQFDSVKRAHS